MALPIVLGLTILGVANYVNTYEFAGQPKPISPLANQQGAQFMSPYGYNSVPQKQFGTPYAPFKQSYQPYPPYTVNNQQLRPYPGYPGPVVYPGHGGYQGPRTYHLYDPNRKSFGNQQFPAPTQQVFNQKNFKQSENFNKNFPGLSNFNQGGQYFPPVKPFTNTVPLVIKMPTTVFKVVIDKQNFGGAEDHSEQQYAEVIGEQSAGTTAADTQHTSSTQDDVTSGVSSDAQVPTAEVY